jgi:UDP-N-acetylmuramoylalanine--D-glutamate ligase
MSDLQALQALRSKRIGILGYGKNHRALVAWLVRQGLTVTVRDRNPAVQEDIPGVQWEIRPEVLENLGSFDVIFRSPGIPFHARELQEVIRRGVIVTSQTRLFFQLCPCEIVGVTGTKGKGTTSTLIAALLQKGYRRGTTYLAGNVGIDPFEFLDTLTDTDLVVLELSSFQLTDLHVSPQVAVVLRVTPDHLDHHGSLTAYHEAKAQLVRHQRPQDLCVMNTEYRPDMVGLMAEVQGKLMHVTRFQPQRDAGWVERLNGRDVLFVQKQQQLESVDITDRKLLGEHNFENIIPAVIVALHFGVHPGVIQRVITEFSGLAHRLEPVLLPGKSDVTFIDDSIATNPGAGTAAIHAFPKGGLHLILGGKLKVAEADMAEYVTLVAQRAKTVTFLPGSGTALLEKMIRRAVKKQRSTTQLLGICDEPIMEKVLAAIHSHLSSGDVVLLSPVAASAPPFPSYVERSEAFRQALQKRYGEAS